MSKRLVILAMIVLAAFINPVEAWDKTGNVTEHSYIQLSGYMDEMKVYQTDKGYKGQKLVVGTQGSGTVSRTQSAYVSDDELSFNEWGVFNYKPYNVGSSNSGASTQESDMRNALCAKNYAMGTVLSESYSGFQSLVKDTSVYQTDNVSVYQIGSTMTKGTATIGARVKDDYDGATVMSYGGTYIGDFTIREVIGVGGDVPYLYCP